MAKARSFATAACLLWIAVTDSASALEPFPCETVTKRPKHAILVPLAGEDAPNLPEHAVWIEDGETLCLTGTLLDNGALAELRFRSDQKASSLLLSISLVVQGEHSSLVVRHSFSRPLHYSIVRLPRQAELALTEYDTTVKRGIAAVEHLSGAPTRIALTNIRVETEQPTIRLSRRRPVVAPEWRLHRPSSRVSLYALSGVQSPEFAHSSALVSSGYSRLPNAWPRYGIGSALWAGRARLALDLVASATSSTSENRKTTARHLEVSLYGGWSFLRLDRFLADLSAGVAFGSMVLERTFEECPLPPCSGDRTRGDALALQIEQGAGYLVWLGQFSKLALLFGYRAGYAWQPGSIQWDTAGPKASITGPRITAWVGVVGF